MTEKIKINVAFVDFTGHLNPELKHPKLDKLFSVYVYDPGLGVHICSMTASSEMWLVDSAYTCSDDLTEEEREDLDEWVRDACAHDEMVEYFDYRSVEGSPRVNSLEDVTTGIAVMEGVDEVELDEDEEDPRREAMERVIEDLCGNPIW